MTAKLVERLLCEMSKRRKRVVVIGDAMTDRWVHGYLDNCMDGCQKFVQDAVVDVPGGAANAERCLSDWGGDTSLCSYPMSHRPVKCRYVDDGKIVFRADDERALQASEPRYLVDRSMATEMVYCAGAVLLSDYDKGFLTPELIREVAEICRARGIPCVADCKRSPGVYAGCVLKGNETWASRHSDLGSGGSVRGLVVTYRDKIPIAVAADGDMTTKYTLPPVGCINHVGAGDCFAAHLTLALAYGFTLKEAAELAHSAGRVYVQRPHNYPPSPAEVAADLATAR